MDARSPYERSVGKSCSITMKHARKKMYSSGSKSARLSRVERA